MAAQCFKHKIDIHERHFRVNQSVLQKHMAAIQSIRSCLVIALNRYQDGLVLQNSSAGIGAASKSGPLVFQTTNCPAGLPAHG